MEPFPEIAGDGSFLGGKRFDIQQKMLDFAKSGLYYIRSMFSVLINKIMQGEFYG